ncbi:MAG: Dipeptide transport system permease protein DppC [uncultured Corynebacteriales bacterium]|uniref:Dipeptide transport system permease protein DppC n=1 Tax=uncultured Mycobacteriales bacterium TaxID=581187 RepID=A0A6J4I5G2_9ACTN|nr:MAG: Dipeptide transport system permease protein DppC [uncultured Corynebacteriales bacterium]
MTTATQVDAAGGVFSGDESGGGRWSEAFRRLRRNPVAILGAVLVLLFVLVAIFAPWLAPHDPQEQLLLGEVRPGFVPGPREGFPLGVDSLGRDELSRLLYGSRQSLLVGIVSTLLGLSLGLLLGGLAGAFGGRVDNVLMRVTDLMLSIPGLLTAITITVILGPSLTSVMIAIAIVNVPIFARLLRGSMLAQRDADYVLAARSIGLRRRTIVLSHIVPNSLGPVIVQATLTLATSIIDAAALSFLGLGNQDGTPEWGQMLAEAQDLLGTRAALAFYPCIAIVIAALGFTLLGEALREALDPKFRR